MLEPKTALINFGDISKPATVLIEKISNAIEGYYRPHQIVRVAQANAEAQKIEAVAQVEITDIQRRALNRFLAEESVKQNNIESITRQALPDVNSQAKPETIQDDWITNFFDKGRLVSDGEMQRLWARILAGEANTPGKFSKRTIKVLSELDKAEAHLFTELNRFSIPFGLLRFPLVYEYEDDIFKQSRLTFANFSHLQDAGLIHFNILQGFAQRGCARRGYVKYFDQVLYVEFKSGVAPDLSLGHVLYSRMGQQLSEVCPSQKHEGFIDYVTKHWKALGYVTEPPPGSPPTSIQMRESPSTIQ